MTVGSGIFASTILLVLVVGLWQATLHRKWKLIGKVVAILIATSTMIGLLVWGWQEYASRPQVQNALDGISLGATQLDVQLQKGKPSRELKADDGSKDLRWFYFDNPDQEDQFTFVMFTQESPNAPVTASIVCRHANYVDLLGFTTYSKESLILKKLGSPTYTSIRADGLAKAISYQEWRAAFEFEKGDLVGVCVSASGKIRFSEEHAESIGVAK